MLSFLKTRPRTDPTVLNAGSLVPREQQVGHDKFIIFVGREVTEFVVDTEVLTQGNDFFETRFIRALTEEGGHRILRLPHIKTQVFKAYLQWAYSKRVIVMDSATARDSSSKTGEQIRLSNLFDFAHRIADVALQNAVIDAFLETLKEPLVGRILHKASV